MSCTLSCSLRRVPARRPVCDGSCGDRQRGAGREGRLLFATLVPRGCAALSVRGMLAELFPGQPLAVSPAPLLPAPRPPCPCGANPRCWARAAPSGAGPRRGRIRVGQIRPSASPGEPLSRGWGPQAAPAAADRAGHGSRSASAAGRAGAGQQPAVGGVAVLRF